MHQYEKLTTLGNAYIRMVETGSMDFDATIRDAIREADPGVGDPAIIEAGRPSLDYSQFDRLVLELKGDAGGERVRVAIKDRDDPDEEAPPSVELTLTDEWQPCEIELASFPPVDLNVLHVPLAFVFERETGAAAFSVRSARYVAAR